MTARPTSTVQARGYQVFLVLPPAWAIWRFALILPPWINGQSPAYPGQFGGRLRFAIILTGIAGSALLGQSAMGHTRRGKRLARLALLLTMLAMVVDVAITESPM